MEENRNEENFEEKNFKEECDKKTCWLKYLVITLAAFFGAFLAVYFVADNLMHHYMMPPVPRIVKINDINDIIDQQEKMMEDMANMPTIINPFMMNPIQIHTYQDGDDYKIIIDLKSFNGKPDNIKIDAKSKRVTISGESDSKTKDSSKDISFSQTFSLPKKIDTKDISKEVKGNKYIITLPIKD